MSETPDREALEVFEGYYRHAQEPITGLPAGWTPERGNFVPEAKNGGRVIPRYMEESPNDPQPAPQPVPPAFVNEMREADHTYNEMAAKTFEDNPDFFGVRVITKNGHSYVSRKIEIQRLAEFHDKITEVYLYDKNSFAFFTKDGNTIVKSSEIEAINVFSWSWYEKEILTPKNPRVIEWSEENSHHFSEELNEYMRTRIAGNQKPSGD